MARMKIGFLSLGCPKNLVDGEVMLGIARDAGHEITPDSADADVLVVNTCAFIDNAKEESINAILEMAALKRDGRCSRLVVTGCLAERYRAELKKEIPEIDALIGTGEVADILDAVDAGSSGAREFVGSKDRRRVRLHLCVLHHPDVARVVSQPHDRVDRAGSARAGGAGGARAAADLAGQQLLRHR